MDDAAIEAAAAAIVARAMAEEAATGSPSPGAGSPAPPFSPAGESAPGGTAWPAAALSPRHEVPVPPGLPDKDRAWLIAGLILCALLIVFAVALSRLLAGT